MNASSHLGWKIVTSPAAVTLAFLIVNYVPLFHGNPIYIVPIFILVEGLTLLVFGYRFPAICNRCNTKLRNTSFIRIAWKHLSTSSRTPEEMPYFCPRCNIYYLGDDGQHKEGQDWNIWDDTD